MVVDVYSYVCVTVNGTKYYTGFVNTSNQNEHKINTISWTQNVQ